MKLHLVAVLGSVYVIAWLGLGLGARAPGRSVELSLTEPTREPPAQRQVATWYQDLPSSARPVVQLPAGWHIAADEVPAPSGMTRAVPAPRRVSPPRAGRIRTRSS